MYVCVHIAVAHARIAYIVCRYVSNKCEPRIRIRWECVLDRERKGVHTGLTVGENRPIERKGEERSKGNSVVNDHRYALIEPKNLHTQYIQGVQKFATSN